MKATEQYFSVVLLVESVDEILKCGHSNKSYWAVFYYAAVYFPIYLKLKFDKIFEFPLFGG